MTVVFHSHTPRIWSLVNLCFKNLSVFSGNRSDDITVIARKLFILNLHGSQHISPFNNPNSCMTHGIR
jgi:hypothetical protein